MVEPTARTMPVEHDAWDELAVADRHEIVMSVSIDGVEVSRKFRTQREDGDEVTSISDFLADNVGDMVDSVFKAMDKDF